MKLVRSMRLLHYHVEPGFVTVKDRIELRYDFVMPLVLLVIVFRAFQYKVGYQRRLVELVIFNAEISI